MQNIVEKTDKINKNQLNSLAFLEICSIIVCVVVENERKELILKTFFDGIFIDKNRLLEEGIKYPVKIEYVKTITGKENVENKYGIEIVKTEYKDGNIKVESNEVPNITNNLNEADRILALLRDNEVTPIAMKDVLDDLTIQVQ